MDLNPSDYAHMIQEPLDRIPKKYRARIFKMFIREADHKMAHWRANLSADTDIDADLDRIVDVLKEIDSLTAELWESYRDQRRLARWDIELDGP